MWRSWPCAQCKYHSGDWKCLFIPGGGVKSMTGGGPGQSEEDQRSDVLEQDDKPHGSVKRKVEKHNDRAHSIL